MKSESKILLKHSFPKLNSLRTSKFYQHFSFRKVDKKPGFKLKTNKNNFSLDDDHLKLEDGVEL